MTKPKIINRGEVIFDFVTNQNLGVYYPFEIKISSICWLFNHRGFGYMVEKVKELWGDEDDNYRLQSEECLSYICDCITTINGSKRYPASKKVFDMPIGCIIKKVRGGTTYYHCKSYDIPMKERFIEFRAISCYYETEKIYICDEYSELSDSDISYVMKEYGAQKKDGYILGFTFVKNPIIPAIQFPEEVKFSSIGTKYRPRYKLYYGDGGESILELALKYIGGISIPIWRLDGSECNMNDTDKLFSNIKSLLNYGDGQEVTITKEKALELGFTFN